MGRFKDYKPAMAMLALQFTYAGVNLSTRAVLMEGVSPRVFVVYRSKTSESSCLGWRSFWTIFWASLVGVTINQNIFFEGLYLASSSLASAMGNLVPAITIVIASCTGLEKLNIGSMRSVAKIIGTMLCVGGAISMALFRGPKLLNSEEPLKQLMPSSKSLLGSWSGGDWLLGCLFLFGSSCCWSLWLILQVPASASCPDSLSLSAWTCFMATLQSAAVAIFIENDANSWKLHSYLQLTGCLYSGIIGSAFSFVIQAWCISLRGPLFSAMFNPLCTVIVSFSAAAFLHEKIYAGSLIGTVGVIGGLYVVLWGKAKDLIEDEDQLRKPVLQIRVDDESMILSSEIIDLEKPLLSDKSEGDEDVQSDE
ncbi:WAT1-related protein At4g30420-like isoform X2 [Diospyros lotus]|uniref:WAT1-related protein At4g30420-like isoform X2 n=1 Tax=Diospyros lotus TaxID=55363 RepID=UPI00225A0E54|nr:WAT1-related protein At4g30420-like isoform X2 [Diospyros lotus]